MAVNLIIKSATQTVEDFSLDCELPWTISMIKDKIAELYPTKPKKENQKLIYGGKLLPDHLSLKCVLNHAQERHIMHLVCPSPAKPNQTETDKTASTQSFPVPPSNPTFPPVSQPVLNSPSGPMVNVDTVNPVDAFQQYLAMQQMYAQFMTQYLSQYNNGMPPVIPYAPAVPTPPVQTPQVPAPQQNPPPNPPQRQAEEEGHDYLDYLYIFSRTVMLFAVLYYYSSLSRIIIVLLMFLFITIYVKVNRQNQEMQRQAIERQRIETAVTQPVAADIQASGSEENASSSSTSDDSNDASLSQQTEGRSFASVVSVTVSLISAFFSSLIPSEPVPVNVN